MNCYGAKNLAESWRTVRKNTIRVAEDIPEDKYGFKAAPDTMSVAEMLVHGRFVSLDLSPLATSRIGRGEKLLENCVI